jgi:hypothetical protein
MLRVPQWALGSGFVVGLFSSLLSATLAVTVALRES